MLGGVDDFAVVGAVGSDEGEEIVERGFHAGDEGAVAAASVHQIGRHFAAQLQAGLHDEAGKPGDAVNRKRLCRQTFHGGNKGGADASHLVFEVVFSDGLYGEDGFKTRFAGVAIIIDEIEHLLIAAADGTQELGV